MTHNKEIYHLLYNHQGSLRAVVDEEGTLIKELHYNSFGTITLDTNPDFEVEFGFAGGLYDKDTKLTRFGYRDYDAKTGKWTAKDPIGFSGGDTNLYGYVLGDPVNLVDPTGEFALALPYLIPWGAAALTTGYMYFNPPPAFHPMDWSDFGGSDAYCVDKNTQPDHPDFQPHKKKDGLEKIPWNKNKKGWPDKNGDYWEPVPDGHKGTHDPHWDVQHPNGTHTPKYPPK
jgi:RHS repeat-associated protein